MRRTNPFEAIEPPEPLSQRVKRRSALWPRLAPLFILFFLLAGSSGIGIDQALAVLFQAV